ncbi:MAG: hypothetical protein VKL41_11890 [Snowella sp.]|jgi:hypothetical protein|nr:hypothetical protein [Snowella sp.]
MKKNLFVRFFLILLIALLNTNAVLGAEKIDPSISKDWTEAQVNIRSLSGHSPLAVAQADIINPIKLYVQSALKFGNQSASAYSISGYHLQDRSYLVNLSRSLEANARKWDAIADNFKQKNTDLYTYASKLILTGNDIIQAIDKMPPIELATQKVGDTNFQNWSINIPFKKDNGEIAYQLKDLLGIIKRNIETEKQETAKVKTEISNFRKEIATQLEPDVNRLENIIKREGSLLLQIVQNLHRHLIDAERATGQLDFTWQAINSNIEASLEEINSINDSMSLLVFKAVFERAINSWVTVKNYCHYSLFF